MTALFLVVDFVWGQCHSIFQAANEKSPVPFIMTAKINGRNRIWFHFACFFLLAFLPRWIDFFNVSYFHYSHSSILQRVKGHIIKFNIHQLDFYDMILSSLSYIRLSPSTDRNIENTSNVIYRRQTKDGKWETNSHLCFDKNGLAKFRIQRQLSARNITYLAIIQFLLEFYDDLSQMVWTMQFTKLTRLDDIECSLLNRIQCWRINWIVKFNRKKSIPKEENISFFLFRNEVRSQNCIVSFIADSDEQKPNIKWKKFPRKNIEAKTYGLYLCQWHRRNLKCTSVITFFNSNA